MCCFIITFSVPLLNVILGFFVSGSASGSACEIGFSDIVSADSFAETVASSDDPCETSVVWEQPAGRSSDTRRIIVIVFSS